MEKARIAEQRAHVDGETGNEPIHARGIVQGAVEQARYGSRVLDLHPVPDPPADRVARVVPEVEASRAVDRFEEQIDLHALDRGPIFLRHQRNGSDTVSGTARRAAARSAGRRPRAW